MSATSTFPPSLLIVTGIHEFASLLANIADIYPFVKSPVTAPSAIPGALAARRWALTLFTGGFDPDDPYGELEALSEEALALMLTSECCAIPVARLVRSMPGQPPSWAARVIQRRELLEFRRLATARRQLLALDALAARHGLRPIAIKGAAVLLADRELLDMGDIDMELPFTAAVRFASLLDEQGYRRSNCDTVDHLAPRIAPDSLPVEIHPTRDSNREVAFYTRAEAGSSSVGDFKAIRRARGGDEVLRLLGHSIIHHPHRRGHLRDIIAIADALRDCEAPDVSAAFAAGRATRFEAEWRRMLDLAIAVRDQSPRADPTLFQLVAARKYELLTARSTHMSLHGAIPAATFWAFGSRKSPVHAVREFYPRVVPANVLDPARGLHRISPRTGRFARHVFRTPIRLMFAVSAIFAGATAYYRASRRLEASTRITRQEASGPQVTPTSDRGLIAFLPGKPRPMKGQSRR